MCEGARQEERRLAQLLPQGGALDCQVRRLGWLPSEGASSCRKIGAICRRGRHVGSVDLRDMIGPSAPHTLEVLDNIAERLTRIHSPWLIGGDFNATPHNYKPQASLS